MTVVVIAGSRRRSPLNKLTQLLLIHEPDYVVHGGEPGTDAVVSEAIANAHNLSIREVVVKKDNSFDSPGASHAKAIKDAAYGLAEGETVVCFHFGHPQDEDSRRIAHRCEKAAWGVVVVDIEDN